MKYWLLSAVAIVAVIIGAGLWLIESPGTTRMRRADDQRVQHMSQMQYDVLNYWQTQKSVPDSLDTLAKNGAMLPKDPETQQLYRYEKVSNEQFKLCATFALASELPNTNQYGYYGPYPTTVAGTGPFKGGEQWNHGAGEVCFDRTIDIEYQRLNKMITW